LLLVVAVAEHKEQMALLVVILQAVAVAAEV
jgi:hypothetical protein